MNNKTLWASALYFCATLVVPSAGFSAISAGDGLILMGADKTTEVVEGETSFEMARRGRGGDTPRFEWRSDSRPGDSANRGWNREDDRTRDADSGRDRNRDEDDQKDDDRKKDDRRD